MRDDIYTPISPLAIVHCQLITPNGTIPSGILLLDQGIITAGGWDVQITVPPEAILVDAHQGRVGLAARRGRQPRPIILGAPADLVCLDETDQIQWAMRRGIWTHPLPPTDWWQQQHQQAIDWARQCLAQRDQHLGWETPPRPNIDLAWRFRDPQGNHQTVHLRIIPQLHHTPHHLFLPHPQLLPDAHPDHTAAHWWFLAHAASGQFYCFPTPPLQSWLHQHLTQLPIINLPHPHLPLPLQGWLIPLDDLQQAIPSTRILPCHDLIQRT